MSFKVLWRENASIEMFAQLVRSLDKRGLMKSAEEIERFLAANPHEAGEGRDGIVRLLYLRPLCVLYSVNDDEQTVWIERLQWVGP